MDELNDILPTFFDQYDPQRFILKLILKMLLVLLAACLLCLSLGFPRVVIIWMFFILNYSLFTCFIGNIQDRSLLFILLWTCSFVILALSHLVAQHHLAARSFFIGFIALGSWSTYRTKYQRLFSELACILAVSWLYKPIPRASLGALALVMLFSGLLYMHGILLQPIEDGTAIMLKWIKYSLLNLAKQLKDILQQKAPTTIVAQKEVALTELQEKVKTILRLQSQASSMALCQQYSARFVLLIKHAYHLLYQYHKLVAETHQDTSPKVALETMIYLVYGVPYLTDHEFNQKILLLNQVTQQILVDVENTTPQTPLPNLRIYEFVTLCSAVNLNLVHLRHILREIKNLP